MYRVVLIDADDTLFDYEKSEKHAMRKVFEDFGFFERNSEEEYFSIIVFCGRNWRKGILQVKI